MRTPDVSRSFVSLSLNSYVLKKGLYWLNPFSVQQANFGGSENCKEESNKGFKL